MEHHIIHIPNIFKWLLSKWYKHSPECICGWTMKPFEKYTDRYQWKCIWKKCGWESFDNGDGRLHWFKKDEKKLKKALTFTNIIRKIKCNERENH